jgi:hypothetical protein
MIMPLLLFISNLSWATPMPGPWTSAYKIVEQHEFYAENKIVTEPKESWQHLFSILLLNENFEDQKDCVFYYVAGDMGKLKTKTIDPKESCLDQLMKSGDEVWEDVKDLQFAHLERGLKLSFTQKKKIINWEILTQGFKSPVPELHVSSVELKAPRYILLAKAKTAKKVNQKTLSQGEICHSINDECEEISQSTCQYCPEGWYEVPNGCPKGPKYCGLHNCGGRNSPACRRGMEYQRKKKEFDCRVDSSFAYCQQGLIIQCEGQKAYCR